MHDDSDSAADVDETARILSLLATLTGTDATDIETFDSSILPEARTHPRQLALVATSAMASDRVLMRCAAAIALGRAAEFADESSIFNIERVLTEHITQELDDYVVDCIATALVHVWGRRDDYQTELRLVDSPDYRLRVAAAQAISLGDISGTPELQAALRALAADNNDRVRYWAELGLSELDE